MREEQQQGSGDVAGRRGGVIRALLGVERRLADATEGEGAVGVVSSGKQPDAAGSGEERKAVVRVVAADMPPALQRRAFRCARDELAAMPHYPRRLEPKRLALALKKEFDTAYGPAWHCIVGTSFGSYVTHARGGFLYFSVDKVYILLFRTAVEPSPHSPCSFVRFNRLVKPANSIFLSQQTSIQPQNQHKPAPATNQRTGLLTATSLPAMDK